MGQAWLSSAVGGVSNRTMGDGFVWDLRNSTGDVTPLVAVTVALRALRQLPELAPAAAKPFFMFS